MQLGFPTKGKLARMLSFLSVFLLGTGAYYAKSAPRQDKQVVLFDLYHHQPIKQKIMEGRLEMGGLDSPIGKYLLDDRAHGNGYPLFRLLLSDEFTFRNLTEPITPEILDAVNILVLINPDSKDYLETAHLLSDDEIRAVTEFVRAGGGLFVTVNSWSKRETFELPQTNKLLRHFGIEFERTWTSHYKCPVPDDSPFLFNVSALLYGGGCTIKVLEHAPGVRVDVILEAIEEEVKRGDDYLKRPEEVPLGLGPIITLSHYGKGRVIAVGDSGTWAHDDLVMDAQNLEILKQLISLLRTPGMNLEYKPPRGRERQYKGELIRFIAAASSDLLAFLSQPAQVRTESTPPKSYFREFLYDYLDFELKRSTGEKNVRGDTRTSFQLHRLQEGTRLNSGNSEFYLAPKGQVVRRTIRAESPEGGDLLNALMDGASVTFSDPLIEVGGAWDNDIWVKVLPLEMGRQNPARRKVKAQHLLEQIEERQGVRCAKIVTYGLLDLREVSLSELVSTETLQTKVGQLRVEQGQQVFESIQYLGLADGELIESETYLRSSIWLTGLGFEGNKGLVYLYERLILQ